MLVSFILPAYKGRFLREAISSILSQTYVDFELVIVNDKSPDNIKEIVSGFDDKRIRYYENPENIGGKNLVANWNHCLSLAASDWGILASDDDVYEKDFLLELINLTTKYPDVDLFHCRFQIINSEGEAIGFSEPCLEYECAEEFIFQNIIKRRRQVVPNFMFRMSAIKKIGGFVNFPLAWGSDDMTWCKLTIGKGVAFNGKTLFSWRYSGFNISGLTNNIDEKIEARIQLNSYLKNEILPQLKKDNEQASFFSHLIMTYGEKAIKRESMDMIRNTKSLRFVMDMLNNKNFRHFIGRKQIFGLLLNSIRARLL